jgi:hypothetical protein
MTGFPSKGGPSRYERVDIWVQAILIFGVAPLAFLAIFLFL